MNVGNDATLVDGERFSASHAHILTDCRDIVGQLLANQLRARERFIDCLFNAPDAIQHY